MNDAPETRPVVLVCMGAFWPGSDSSGPNVSLIGLCRALGDEFEFRILARDRAFGAASAPLPTGIWHDKGFAKVRYCEMGRFGAGELGAIMRETPHDLLWLNGFFDREFTLPALILRRLGRIPHKPTLLSPRGEFAAGAMGLKSAQKRLWLALTKFGGLLKDVKLHATGPHERADIASGCSWSNGIVDAPNVRAMIDAPPHEITQDAPKLVFLGRISRVKNLDYALNVLKAVKTPLSFDIYGPISDPGYWAECEQIIKTLPVHIKVELQGEIANEAVPDMMGGADLLFLPTKGENFGHAIFEALACNVPVLISDQTPWRNLAQDNAGWDLALASKPGFVAALENFAAMSAKQRQALQNGAKRRAESWVKASDSVTANQTLLHHLLQNAAKPARGH